MKLLIIWHAGGVKTYFKRYISLAKEYDQVKIIIPGEWNEGGKKIEITRPIELRTNCEILPIGIYSIKRQAIFLFKYEQLKKNIINFDPDVVHIHEEPWSLCSFQILYVCKNIKNKVIVFDSAAINFGKKYFPFNYVENISYKNADLIFARNCEVVSVLTKRGFNGPIKILGNGVDTQIFKGYGSFFEKYVIIFVGRIIKEKGVFLLFNAFKRLLEEIKSRQVKLLYLGSGNDKKKLMKLVTRYEMNGQVFFHERVPSEKVKNYILKSRVLVLPSISTRKWKEQFGRVLVESLALGRPVIGSSCGAIPDVINNRKYVFKENDSNDLLQHLKYIMDPQNNNEIQNDIREMRENVIKKFDWDNLAIFHRKVIDSLLKEKFCKWDGSGE